MEVKDALVEEINWENVVGLVLFSDNDNEEVIFCDIFGLPFVLDMIVVVMMISEVDEYLDVDTSAKLSILLVAFDNDIDELLCDKCNILV